MNYGLDSENLWGRFLHHRRARTAEEFKAIPESYALTKQVYEDRFGRKPPSSVWGASTDASSMCGGGGGVNPSESGPVSNGDSAPAPAPPPPGDTTSRQN